MQRHRFHPIAQWLRTLLLLGGTALLAGCFGDGKMTTIQPESDQGRVIQDVYALVTWIDVGILIVVTVLFLYAVVKFRAAKGREQDIPEQVHGNNLLEVVWTIVPAVILIFIAVPTWSGIFNAATPPPTNTLQVKAIGHQWWWEFDYPELGVVTANELYLPVGKSVVVDTTSVDVIHAFWVPKLAGKIDSMPTRENMLWFTPEKEGLYYGQCAEYCGTSHANMRFRVRVVSQADFDAWVAKQKQPPAPQSDDAKAGSQLFASKTCIACHTISGNPMAVGQLGPNLTNLPARSSLAAGIIENTQENLVRWLRHTQEVKPGAKMGVVAEDGSYHPIDMTDQEAMQLAAYLLSEPGEAMADSGSGGGQSAAMTSGGGQSAQDIIAAKGCGACHVIPGVPGAVGAVGPSLAGLMSRDKIAGGKLENTPENLHKWIKNPPAVKPGTAMPPLPISDAELDTLVEFLTTLK